MAEVDAAAPRTEVRPPPPPPPPPKVEPAQVAAQAEKTAVEASAVNERLGTEGQALLDTQKKTAVDAPVEPVAKEGADLDAAYKDAGAVPPTRDEPTAAQKDGQPRDAATAAANADNRRETLDALAKRAGIERPSGPTMDPRTINGRKEAVSWNLQNGVPTQGPPNGDVIDIKMSDQEKAAIGGTDAEAKRKAANEVGLRVATQESFERAVGGPENATKIEAAYQASSKEERAKDAPQMDRQKNSERFLSALPFGDAAVKADKGDYQGALKSAAVDGALMAAGGIIGAGVKAALPAIKGMAKAGAEKVSNLFKGAATKADDVATKADDVAKAPEKVATPVADGQGVVRAADGTKLSDDVTRNIKGKTDAAVDRHLTKEQGDAIVKKQEADRAALSRPGDEVGKDIAPNKAEKLAAHQLVDAHGADKIVVGETNVKAVLGQSRSQTAKESTTDLLRKEANGKFTPIEVKASQPGVNGTAIDLNKSSSGALGKFQAIDKVAGDKIAGYEVVMGRNQTLPANFKVDGSGRLYQLDGGAWSKTTVGGKDVTIRKAFLGD